MILSCPDMSCQISHRLPFSTNLKTLIVSKSLWNRVGFKIYPSFTIGANSILRSLDIVYFIINFYLHDCDTV